MRRSKHKTIDKRPALPTSTLARCVAPEDIEPGDFVTLLHVVYELPSFLWCADATTLPIDQPVRVQLLPEPAGVPLKVKAVCLPFLLVERPSGKRQTIDLRRCRLARLSRSYARASWKARKRRRSKK